ncbi:unnamed protein product [Rangifer tarandus platyrhynchus]|uniref:Uncharacterized protein n=2 Tax=Rangifer tarandus platyrhynchus TaxID=3082113 RepID=A0ABN8Z169_RANTA|nr:unnamed protein product [Rangifer tarandus platyrhynchus]CAI9703581.1 unnamed protein product [Rangifer tarandus platyrhynchus]
MSVNCSTPAHCLHGLETSSGRGNRLGGGPGLLLRVSEHSQALGGQRRANSQASTPTGSEPERSEPVSPRSLSNSAGVSLKQ